MGSLEEHFQHINILCLPKLYSFSVGKFMHSYHNKLLQIILMNILFHSAQFIITPQDQQSLKTCFYLELTISQENVLLTLLAQKYGLQYQTILNFQPPLPLNGNLRNTSYMKKFPIMNFSNSSLVQNKILCILAFCNSVLFIVCIYLFLFSVCIFYAFRYEVHFLFFSVLLCFLLCLINQFFVTFFTFLLIFFNFFVLLKIF